MQFKFSSLLVFVLAAVTVQAAPVSKAAISITAPGVTSVPAKADGCAHITPTGQNAQNVCAKSVTASGFNLSVTDLTTGAKTNCKVVGTSGTCGTTGAGATIGAADAAAGTADAAATDAGDAGKPAKAAKGKKTGKKSKKTAKGGAAAAASPATITATGVASVPAKADGCAHITPEGANAQNVCAKQITASGFNLSVTDLTTGAKSNCKITGTSGTCGTTGAGATVGAAPAASDKASGGAAAASPATITAPGVDSVPAKADGCAHITPEGANAQNVCAKSITATGFKLTVTDLTTNAKSSCTIVGTSGKCGTTGAGATVSAPAKRDLEEEELEERATQVPAGVDITITGKGAKDVGANHFGCANITPAGKGSQLVCTKLFTSKGFTLSVEDHKTGVRTSCLIEGTTGTCGPNGAGATLSSLPKREFEDDFQEIEEREW